MGEIGKLRHKAVIRFNNWVDNGYGGQNVDGYTEKICALAIIGSNGKETFQNAGIFNIKTLTCLIRTVDSDGVTEGNKIFIDGDEYNINNVETYEKDLNYRLIIVSKQMVTGG